MLEKPVETKRVKISKAQRLTLVEVLGASLILGACLVISGFLLKYIDFNTKVITAKNNAISEYDQTIRNVGVCEDLDRNGRLNDAELNSCRPNQTTLEKVVGTLRYNIYETMAHNADLESVARNRDKNGVCYENGVVRDFTTEYNRATTDKERQQALQGMKLCSSLRVISDALPSHKNTEALMASLNQLFIVADVMPDNMAPLDDLSESDIEGLGKIPVTFRMRGTGAEVLRVLDSVERSVRSFNFTVGTFEWNSTGIEMSAQADAYYLDEAYKLETTATIRAKGSGKVTKS